MSAGLPADHPVLDRLAFEGFVVPLIPGFALVVHVRASHLTHSPAPVHQIGATPLTNNSTPWIRSGLDSLAPPAVPRASGFKFMIDKPLAAGQPPRIQ